MSRVAERLLAHIEWLASKRLVYVSHEAADYLGCSDSSISFALRDLEREGHITVNVVQSVTGRRRKFHHIRLANGKGTRWPPECGKELAAQPIVVHQVHDDILDRRIRVEEGRAAHVRHWLAEELHPRAKRPREERFFIDRETARALQGGFA